MRSYEVNQDAVAKANANGDMFYVADDGSGRQFRVCKRHQPDPTDPNDGLDYTAMADCDDCSEVDPFTAEDIDSDDEGDDSDSGDADF